jgi:hypothetical protein
MAATVPISLTTLTNGQVITLSPTVISATSQAVFDIARNVGASPLNGLGQGSPAIDMVLQFSQDAGATYPDTESENISGGVFNDRAGAQINTTRLTVTFAPTSNRVRGSVTAHQTVSVSGSVTLS